MERYFKTLSAVQVLGSRNADRVKYNKSVLEAVRDLSKFADKHSASDSLQVLQVLKRQVKENFGSETVYVEDTDFPTEIAQLYGIIFKDDSGRLNVWWYVGF